MMESEPNKTVVSCMQCHLKELMIDFQNYECEEAHYLTRAVYSPSSDPLKAIPAGLLGSWLVGFFQACTGI